MGRVGLIGLMVWATSKESFLDRLKIRQVLVLIPTL